MTEIHRTHSLTSVLEPLLRKTTHARACSGPAGHRPCSRARAQDAPSAQPDVSATAPAPRIVSVSIEGSTDPAGRIESLVATIAPLGAPFVESGEADRVGTPIGTVPRLQEPAQGCGLSGSDCGPDGCGRSAPADSSATLRSRTSDLRFGQPAHRPSGRAPGRDPPAAQHSQRASPAPGGRAAGHLSRRGGCARARLPARAGLSGRGSTHR